MQSAHSGEDAELASELTWDPLSREPHSFLHIAREQTDGNGRKHENPKDIRGQSPKSGDKTEY